MHTHFTKTTSNRFADKWLRRAPARCNKLLFHTHLHVYALSKCLDVHFLRLQKTCRVIMLYSYNIHIINFTFNQLLRWLYTSPREITLTRNHLGQVKRMHFQEKLSVKSVLLLFLYVSQYICLCWGFTAQSIQWGHVERGRFTWPHFHWAG